MMERETRSVTYRLLPCTKAKARALSRLAGASRFVWNARLAEQDRLLRIAERDGAGRPSTTFFDLGKRFKSLRDETPWLQELPCAPVRYVLKYQADAWKKFFNGEGGRSKFKARRGDDGVTIPQDVRISHGRLRIPRLGWYVLRRRGDNPYTEGRAKQARITRSCGKWYCTVAYEVVIEDLNVRAMTSSARGTVEDPGTNVKAKSGLNRSILNSGWGLLEGMLSYKTRELTKVPAPYTSQTCSSCGHVERENRRAQSRFVCVACGHEGNADVNAALNILASAQGGSGRRGALALATPMIRHRLSCVEHVSTRNYK